MISFIKPVTSLNEFIVKYSCKVLFSSCLLYTSATNLHEKHRSSVKKQQVKPSETRRGSEGFTCCFFTDDLCFSWRFVAVNVLAVSHERWWWYIWLWNWICKKQNGTETWRDNRWGVPWKDSRKLSLPSGFDTGSTEGFFYSQNNFKF